MGSSTQGRAGAGGVDVEVDVGGLVLVVLWGDMYRFIGGYRWELVGL